MLNSNVEHNCVINCTYIKKDFLEIAKEKSLINDSTIIIDVAGIGLSLEYPNRVMIPRTWDEDNQLELRAIKKFTRECSAFSKYFSNIKINELPIYWFTPWSEKHPILHWGKIYFYLLALIQEDEKTNSILSNVENIDIVFPKTNTNSIKKFLRIHLTKKFSARSNVHTEIRNWKYWAKAVKNTGNWVKDYLAFLFSGSKTVKFSKFEHPKYDLKLNFLITAHQGKSLFTDEMFKLGAEKFNTLYIDLPWHNLNSKTSGLSPYNLHYLQYIPRPIQILSLLYTSFKSALSLLIMKPIKDKKRSHPIIAEIRTEILYATLDIKSHSNQLWLTNYLSNQNISGKLFYTDEFYRWGRLISSAIRKSKNKNVVGIGIQHGLFGKHHTVYNVSDEDIDNGIPIPNLFIAWGDRFKSLFMENNNLKDNYCKILPPPRYIETKRLSVKPNIPNLKNILWCTTILETSLIEFNLISATIRNSNQSLCVRLREHPLHPILTKLKSCLDDNDTILIEQFEISSCSISEDFAQTQVTVCSNPSTIFIDSLMHRNPVIIIDSGKSMLAINESIKEGIFIAKNKSEFERCLLLISELYIGKADPISLDLISTSYSDWDQLLNAPADNLKC